MQISNKVYNLAIEEAINKQKYIDFSISEKIEEDEEEEEFKKKLKEAIRKT